MGFHGVSTDFGVAFPPLGNDPVSTRSSHVPGYYEGDTGAGFVASGAEDGKVGKTGGGEIEGDFWRGTEG